MLMGADDPGIDDTEVRIVRHRHEDASPDTLTAPAAEAAEDSVPIPEGMGPIALGQSDAQACENSHVHQAKCPELNRTACTQAPRGEDAAGSLPICPRILAVLRSESPT
jgi:hypothetical protein